MLSTPALIAWIGWVGAAAVLVPYVLLSLGRMTPVSLWYQGLNVLGSLCLIVNTAYTGAYPSTAVNMVWVGIAAYALRKAWLARRGVEPQG